MPIAENLIQKPWGHERIIAKTDKYVVKEIFVREGCRLSKQYHKEKVETMFLVHGAVTLLREGVMYLMKPMVPYLIAPLMAHRLIANQKSDALIVEVSSTELEDVVRLEDDYGREERNTTGSCSKGAEVC